MTLKTPICITSRLLPGVMIGKTEISIEYAGETDEGRTRYRYYIDGEDLEHTGTDLKSGCGGGSLQEGLESLLSFLGACGESYAYGMRTRKPGENADLFPPNVAEWAYRHSDELSMLECELQETEGLIAE